MREGSPSSCWSPRWIALLVLLLALPPCSPSPAGAQASPPQEVEPNDETVRAARDRAADFATSQTAPKAVESHGGGGPPSLPFLNANRIFMLSRLAASGGPGTPDPRLRRWLDERLLAATSSLGEASNGLPRAGLGDAAELDELIELASLLDSLTAGITLIEGRLQGIRNDFAFNQSTELLVAIGSTPGVAAQIDSVRLRWNGYEMGSWKLAPNERLALESGGYRPLHRAFARPESQGLDLELTMTDGRALHGETTVTPASNRLTVVVLEVQSDSVKPTVWTP